MKDAKKGRSHITALLFILALVVTCQLSTVVVSETITPGTYTGYLSYHDEYHGYDIYLHQDEKVIITLGVPSTADFNMMIACYQWREDAPPPHSEHRWYSIKGGLGVSEELEFTAPHDGTYIMVVNDNEGYGSYTLNVQVSAASSTGSYTYLTIGIAIVATIVIMFFILMRRKATPQIVPQSTRSLPPTQITRICPQCGRNLSSLPDDMKNCPYCGKTFETS